MQTNQTNSVPKSADSNTAANTPLLEVFHHRLISDRVVPITKINTSKKIKNPKEKENDNNKHTCCKNFLTRYFNGKCLLERLPVAKWLPSYRLSYFLRDFIAGITVGLTAIPQGIAYSSVAGIETQYGLYSVIMPCFVYIIFGSCKDVSIGPSAIMSLMTYPFTSRYGSPYAILLCFLSGVMILFLSFLQLGSLIDFISLPVTTGFTAAAAITIATAQIKNFLGLKLNTSNNVDTWVSVYTNFDKISWPDALLGSVSMLALLFSRYIKYKSAQLDGDQMKQKIVSKSLWLFGLSGNAIVVICTGLLAYFLSKDDVPPFSIMGNVPGGLPLIKIPQFYTENTTFIYEAKHFGFTVITLPLISIMEMITVGKAFEKGKGVDATQEMIALGLANLAGSFIGSMPVAGSFTRTAINHSSNVKTPLGNLFTGLLALMALSFLTSSFYYIPKATLSALIITAMIFMVEYHKVPLIWKTKKSDLLPLSFSFFSCLFFGIEIGMVVGIITNLCLILHGIARPRIKVLRLNINNQHVLYVVPKQDLLFPAVSHFREIIIENCDKDNKFIPVIIDGSHIHSIDSTTAKGFESLMEDLNARGQPLHLWKWNKLPIRSCLNFNIKLHQHIRYEDSLGQLLNESNIISE